MNADKHGYSEKLVSCAEKKSIKAFLPRTHTNLHGQEQVLCQLSLNLKQPMLYPRVSVQIRVQCISLSAFSV